MVLHRFDFSLSHIEVVVWRLLVLLFKSVTVVVVVECLHDVMYDKVCEFLLSELRLCYDSPNSPLPWKRGSRRSFVSFLCSVFHSLMSVLQSTNFSLRVSLKSVISSSYFGCSFGMSQCSASVKTDLLNNCFRVVRLISRACYTRRVLA